jgi:hypothetical protein
MSGRFLLNREPAPASETPANLPFPIRSPASRHDLNNPITHVMGFGEMLLEEVREQGREDIGRRPRNHQPHIAGQMIAQSKFGAPDPAKIEGGLTDFAPTPTKAFAKLRR